MNLPKQFPKWHAGAAALTLSLAILASAPAMAAEDADKAVRKALESRTETCCGEVIPAWFASKDGMRDPMFRRLVADCYMGHARLSILGIKNGFPLEQTTLSELPAMLLAHESGMDLNIYHPLAGITLVDGPRKN